MRKKNSLTGRASSGGSSGMRSPKSGEITGFKMFASTE